MFIIPATRGTRVDIHSLGEFKSQPGQPSETLPQNQIETDLELCGPVVEHLPSRREPPVLNTRTKCTQIVAIALWSANAKITMWLRSQNALQTTGTPNTTFLLGNPLLTGAFNFLGLCKVIQVLISVDNNSAFFFFFISGVRNLTFFPKCHLIHT